MVIILGLEGFEPIDFTFRKRALLSSELQARRLK